MTSQDYETKPSDGRIAVAIGNTALVGGTVVID